MRKLVKNRKGFTLAEEVVTVLLIGILVASASGILLNAMRIFCQNVIMFNAQSKGIAVMEQLESHLAYAKTIGQQETETIAADDGCGPSGRTVCGHTRRKERTERKRDDLLFRH